MVIFHDTALKAKTLFELIRVDKLFTFLVGQGTTLRSPNDDRAKMTVRT